MKRIDSHQHFWKYNPAEHTWMTDAMQALKKDFLPPDLAPLLSQAGFDGSIAVQARQSLEETNWLLELASQYGFVKGVVGWVDLRSPGIHEVLSGYAHHKKLVGLRHVVHDEPDDNFMLLPEFQKGIAALREFNFTYDLLLYPRHLPVAIRLVEKFPGQPFVLDHMAKPSIGRKEASLWKELIMELAKFPHVYCKLSGMVTEVDWNNWTNDDFKAYLDIVTDAFGTNRIMIGSDWPVCTLSGNYPSTMNIVLDYVNQFSNQISGAILGGNCADFYKIK